MLNSNRGAALQVFSPTRCFQQLIEVWNLQETFREPSQRRIVATRCFLPHLPFNLLVFECFIRSRMLHSLEIQESAGSSRAGGEHDFGAPMFWGPNDSDIEKRVCLNTANPLEPESSNRCGPTHRKIPRGGISLGVPTW